MWQDRRDKFRSDRYKKEWILAYVKKFIHLFPKIRNFKGSCENAEKNYKAEDECVKEFNNDGYVFSPVSGEWIKYGDYRDRPPQPSNRFITEYHNHYNPWYPLSVFHHSDEEINKLIDHNEFGLELGVTHSTNRWNGFMSKPFNMDSMGSEDHLVREMYNPTDQLVWWKTVCGKTIEFKMEL